MRLFVSKLWTTFALAWVLILAVTAMLLVRDPLTRPRLAPMLVLLTLFTALYIAITLRAAIGPADLSPGGPGPAVLQRRLLLVAAMAVLLVSLVALAPHTGIWWLVMHVIVAAGLALPPQLAIGVISGLLIAAMAGAWLVSGALEPMLLTQVSFGAAAVAVRQLTISVAQLRAARQGLARAAVDQERLRFARDLHDLLGHRLALIIIKSELAGRIMATSQEKAAQEIADVEQAARDALREVRVAVLGYRQPVFEHELAAARELLGAAGITVEIEQLAGSLEPALDSLLAWAVREAVTNVVRHSRARHCEIRISRTSKEVRLSVCDDGRGGDVPASAKDGSGLAGLAERAAALGGVLATGPRAEGGFRMALTTPALTEAEP